MSQQTFNVTVHQAGIQFVQREVMTPHAQSAFIAKVVAVYSQRVTCDIETYDGQQLLNIPIVTKAGIIDNKPYGEISLPAVGDYVIIIHASYGDQHLVILGTIIPYLAEEFLNPPIGSEDKQFSEEFLEADKPLKYKRIFMSGTSVEIDTDGTIIVETPSGSFIRIDEDSGDFTMQDSHENIITTTQESVTIQTPSDTHIRLDQNGGFDISDSQGNTIESNATGILINNNLEVLQ